MDINFLPEIEHQNKHEQDQQFRIEQLRQFLSFDPEDRYDEICEEIAELLKDIKFLQEFKYSKYNPSQINPQFLELCRHMILKTYEKDQYIFQQGEEGDSFYIILQGHIALYIDEPTEYINFMQLKLINELFTGQSFGEIALQRNSLRTATAQAKKQTDMIILTKQVFEKYIKDYKNEYLTQISEFLQEVQMFQNVEVKILEEISTKCSMQQYPSNTMILKQGDDCDGLYFVRRGKLKIVKQLQFKIHSVSEQKIKNNIKDPSQEEIEQGLYKNEVIEIDEISNGAIIGDYALFNQTSLDISIITIIPSEVVKISSHDLDRSIPKEQLENYRKGVKNYPTNCELKQIYWEKLQWKQFKKSMIDNIMVHKSNTQAFQNRLRQPIKTFQDIKIPLNKIDIKISDGNLYFNILKNNNTLNDYNKRKVYGLTQFESKTERIDKKKTKKIQKLNRNVLLPSLKNQTQD